MAGGVHVRDEDMHGRGMCVTGIMHGRGHAWWTCVAGGMHDRGHVWQGRVHGRRSMHGRGCAW